MKRILKHTIPVDGKPHEFQLTTLPNPVLDIGRTIDEVEFWAMHDEQQRLHPVKLIVVGTGEALPTEAVWLGTTPRNRAGLVWHLLLIP